MNSTALGIGAVAVAGSVSDSTIITGDITILIQGINALRTDYTTRIKRFLAEYLGTSEHPVPFGGREELVELRSSRCSSSAMRRSSDWIRVPIAARASGEIVCQRSSRMGGVTLIPSV